MSIWDYVLVICFGLVMGWLISAGAQLLVCLIIRIKHWMDETNKLD